MIKFSCAARKRTGKAKEATPEEVGQHSGSHLLAIVLLIVMVGAGCKPGHRARTRVPVREPVCIVKPSRHNPSAQVNFELLASLYPEALVLDVRDFPAIVQYCLVGDRVLLIPDIRGFPVNWWDMLEDYLRRGGLAFFMGMYPFYDRVMGTEENALSFLTYIKQQVERAEHVNGFSAIQLWRHIHDTNMGQGSVRVASDRDLPWDGVVVEVDDFEEQVVMQLDDIPAGTILPNTDAVVFFAKGDARTTDLVLSCVTRDGAVWYMTVPLVSAWQPYLINENEFICLSSGAETTSKQHLSFADISGMSVGLSVKIAPQEPGRHMFGISDLRLLVDQRALDVLKQPDISPLSPSCRHYTSTGNEFESLADKQYYTVKELSFQSPFFTANGWGGTAGAETRLIPLYEGKDKMDISRGWPVVMHLQVPKEQRPPRLWAWVAIDEQNDQARPMLEQAIPATITRLYQRMFLYHAGCDKAVFGPNENMEVSAQWISGCHSGQPLRVSAELHDERGQALRRVVSDSIRAHEKGKAYGPVLLNLGLSPDVQKGSRNYTIRIALEDAAVRGRIYDEVLQPIKVMPAAVADEEWVTVSGARFKLGRRPVFMLGVSFQPLIGQTVCDSERSSTWLDVGYFNSARIAKELDQLEAMGVNALALSYDDPAQAPQLRFFIEEAQKRRMWIYLRVAYLSPFSFDMQKATELIEAAGLAQVNDVFAFDLSCQAGESQDIGSVDAWEKWLVEQYGSIEHAEETIGYPLWRTGDTLDLPPETALVSDGDHRVAVAVFRRFMDDYMSRKYGYIRRCIRALGCPQLLSLQCRFGTDVMRCDKDSFLFADPATGIQHMDFVSLGAAALIGSKERFQEAVFLAAYARGVSGGKPVVWMDYGVRMGDHPALAQLRNQARVGEQMLELSSSSLASGCFAGVAGEPGVSLMSADGTWRPMGEIIRRYARKLVNDSQQPALWKGREFRRSVDARGLPALWARWKDVYRSEVAAGHIEEVRPYGFGRNTLDMALTSVGNSPFSEPAPLEYANAEWGSVRLNDEVVLREPGADVDMTAGQTLTLQLINTGITIWSASQKDKDRTVWVAVDRGDKQSDYLNVGVVPAGEDTEVIWMAPSPGRWCMRPYIQGVGGFGEPLYIQVKE